MPRSATFDDVTGAGYSVSVFTRWEPDAIGYVWVKTRLDADDDPVPDALARRRRASARRTRSDGLADITELGGVPGPWMLRLPHFRLDGKPSFGDEIQTEYFVARSDAPAALRAVRELGDRIRPHLFVSELRTAASDDLWLSGAYQRDFLIIHFTWHNDPAGVLGVLPAIEEALAPFHARPHWGKLHLFDARRHRARAPAARRRPRCLRAARPGGPLRQRAPRCAWAARAAGLTASIASGLAEARFATGTYDECTGLRDASRALGGKPCDAADQLVRGSGRVAAVVRQPDRRRRRDRSLKSSGTVPRPGSAGSRRS